MELPHFPAKPEWASCCSWRRGRRPQSGNLECRSQSTSRHLNLNNPYFTNKVANFIINYLPVRTSSFPFGTDWTNCCNCRIFPGSGGSCLGTTEKEDEDELKNFVSRRWWRRFRQRRDLVAALIIIFMSIFNSTAVAYETFCTLRNDNTLTLAYFVLDLRSPSSLDNLTHATFFLFFWLLVLSIFFHFTSASLLLLIVIGVNCCCCCCCCCCYAATYAFVVVISACC